MKQSGGLDIDGNRKTRKGSGGIRRAFVLYVLVTLVLVVALSGAVIRACVAVQNYILPDSDLVYLTIQRSDAQGNETTITVPMPLDDVLKEIPSMISMEDAEGDSLSAEQDVKYAVTKVENSFSALSPRRQFVYRASRAAMVAVPLMISLIGILLCGFLFYRKKLKPPITLLSCAAKQIGEQNLDFRISYHSGDEMEMLCDSFEQMRQTVQENNRKLWDMIEERRRLQSSVAHDLRNPIAILQGYAQYLQIQLSAEEPISNEKDGDKMNREKISAIVLESSSNCTAAGALYRFAAHVQPAGRAGSAAAACGFYRSFFRNGRRFAVHRRGEKSDAGVGKLPG